MGVLAAGGRLGAVSAQFVNGSLEKNIPVLLFVTSACTVLGGLAAWLLPQDTTGSAMAQIEGSTFDGINSVDDVDRKNSLTVESTMSPMDNMSI